MRSAVSFIHPRDEILQAIQRIYRYRMTTTSGGNLSIREDNGDIWITPARLDKGVGNLPRGRRPTFLHLNTERCGVVGVDIQPATTTLAVSSMDSQFLAQESMSTEKDPGEFIARLSRRIKDLMRAHPRNSYEGIGISLPDRKVGKECRSRW